MADKVKTHGDSAKLLRKGPAAFDAWFNQTPAQKPSGVRSGSDEERKGYSTVGSPTKPNKRR